MKVYPERDGSTGGVALSPDDTSILLSTLLSQSSKVTVNKLDPYELISKLLKPFEKGVVHDVA